MRPKLFRKGRLKSILALLTAAVFVSLCLVGVSAADDEIFANGDASAGGSGGSIVATGGYSLDGDFVSPNTGRTVGYRFTIVNANGIWRLLHSYRVGVGVL